MRPIGLHARSLTFIHPTSQQTITVTAPTPEYWPAVTLHGDCPNFRPTKMGLSPSEYETMTTKRPVRDPFHARDTFRDRQRPGGHLSPVEGSKRPGSTTIGRLPFSIRVLLESALAELRRLRSDRSRTCRTWPAGTPRRPAPVEIPFKPARVRLAGLHRRAVRGRSGRHATRDAAAGRRSRSGSIR